MKKIFASAAAAALLLSGSVAAIPTMASAESYGSDIAKFCQQFSGDVGACVSYYQTGPVRWCQFLKEIDALGFFGLKNQGECVSYFKTL